MVLKNKENVWLSAVFTQAALKGKRPQNNNYFEFKTIVSPVTGGGVKMQAPL